MSIPYLIGVAGAASVFVWVLVLVRRGLLGEKFAVLWLAVASLCSVLAIAPGLLAAATGMLGFTLPVNLLFVGGAVVQLLVSVHLSIETGRRQDESRRLAEDLVLVRARLDAIEELEAHHSFPALK